jgi:SPP1 gp7 family putative phage head morphogenesis protein
MITPQELQRTKAELDRMEEALLTRYLQYSLVRSGHIEQMIAEGQPVESIVKMVWKGLREIWEQNLADAMMEAFQRGYARAQRLMLPYQLQEFPWGAELTAVIRALAAEKVKIEENTTKAKIKEVVMDGIKEGLNPNDIAKNIHEKVGLAMARARNIASTEINFAYSLGHWVGAVEAGVEKVRIVAALDAFVCEHCRALDGKVLDVATLEAGYLPPFHFGCRCHLQPLLGSLARVPTSEDLPSRGEWIGKGFGIPTGNRGMQVVIEQVIPSLRELRKTEISKWIDGIISAPSPYAPSKRKISDARLSISKASNNMTLTQIREFRKTKTFTYDGDVYGGRREAVQGAYFYAGVRHYLSPEIIKAMGIDPGEPVIALQYWTRTVVLHEYAHRLSMSLLPKSIWQEMEAYYGQALEKCVGALEEVLANEQVAETLGRNMLKELRHELSLAKKRKGYGRQIQVRYVIDKLYNELWGKSAQNIYENIMRPFFPSLYGSRNSLEFVAEAAAELGRPEPLPSGAGWVEMARKYLFASNEELQQARTFFKETAPLAEEEVEMLQLSQECFPLRRYSVLKEGREVGEISLGKGCLTYRFAIPIPQLRRELEEVKRTGVFPYIIAGGAEDGMVWDRMVSLANIDEATYGLGRLMREFGLELKEVD